MLRIIRKNVIDSTLIKSDLLVFSVSRYHLFILYRFSYVENKKVRSFKMLENITR